MGALEAPQDRHRQERRTGTSRAEQTDRDHGGTGNSGSHGGAGSSEGHGGAGSSGDHGGAGSSGDHGGAGSSGVVLGGIPVHTEYRCLFFLRYEFFKYRNTGVI